MSRLGKKQIRVRRIASRAGSILTDYIGPYSYLDRVDNNIIRDVFRLAEQFEIERERLEAGIAVEMDAEHPVPAPIIRCRQCRVVLFGNAALCGWCSIHAPHDHEVDSSDIDTTEARKEGERAAQRFIDDGGRPPVGDRVSDGD